MRAVSILAFLTFLLSICASPGFAEQAGPRHHRVLEAAKGLEKPVSYTETKIPLGELVQKVADDTAVRLRAAREVADEPVAVVVKDLPARELLEQLADLLDYRWSRRGSAEAARYEIWQDLASKQREAALRRQMIAGVAGCFRDQIQEEGLMARLPQAQRQAIIDDFECRSKEMEKQTPDQQQAYYCSRAGYQSYRRFIAASLVATPVAGVQADLLSRLSAERWATLWTEQCLIFSSRPAAGEFPLPEEITRRLRAARPSASTVPIFREVQGIVVEQAPPSEEEQQTSWATAAGYRVRVRLEASQFRTHGSLGLEASTQPIFNAGASKPLSFRPGDSLNLSASPRDYDPLIQEDTAERRAALEKDPLLGRRAAFRPTLKPSGEFAQWGPGGSWQGCELLPDLAKATGANFISDAYWDTDSVFGIQISKEPQPLHRWLDMLYLPRQRWDHHGNLIRLRSRTWFLQRPREVPLRFVRRWSQSYFDRGGLSLDDYLDAAVGLKESQLQALEEVADILTRLQWLPRVAEELRDLYPARHALRLYAALSPERRRQLAAGRPLPYSELTPGERPAFLAALDAISIRQHCECLASSTLVHWDEANFSVASGRYTWVDTEDGARTLRPEPDRRLAPSSAPGTAPSAGAPVLPGALPRSPSPPATWRVPGRSGKPAIRWDMAERSSLSRIELELSAGPDLREGYALPVASVP